MSYLGPKKQKILKLATAYRLRKDPDEENVKKNLRTKTLHNPKSTFNLSNKYNRIFPEDADFQINTDEVPPNINKWKRAFSMLEPPVSKNSKKCSNRKIKFLNKSCREIIECITPFMEKLEEEESMDVSQTANDGVNNDEVCLDEGFSDEEG